MKDLRPTVLIVDDILININILYEILKTEYQLEVATTGKKALDILTNNTNIDLVLLDIVMPEMDGYTVCKIMKADSSIKHIPIIFVTSKDEFFEEENGFSLGAADYILKPFHPVIIKSRVRNQINLKFEQICWQNWYHYMMDQQIKNWVC